MQANTVRTPQKPQTKLRAIRGTISNSELDRLVNTAWNFSYCALWNCTQFSSKEMEVAKESIRECLSKSRNRRRAFLTFCQRVLLARNYVQAREGRYIPLPSVWLHKENEVGFAGTKPWYTEIEALRSSLPHYRAEIKALAEAVLDYSEEPTQRNYQFWRSYFIEKQQSTLLELFQISAIHFFNS